jgi:hypothetical protein
LSEDALEDGDWPAVGQAVTERMSELHMSISYAARETGLSPTTIRYLRKPERKYNRSTLVAISVVLGWRYNHLINILRGEPEKNIPKPGNSVMEAHFENLLRAEVGPMREEMTELIKTVNGMGKKIDVIFHERQTSADNGADNDERALPAAMISPRLPHPNPGLAPKPPVSVGLADVGPFRPPHIPSNQDKKMC